MVRKFQRRDSARYSKLGKRRKSKQTWRRPTGRDNKMRERRKGYPAVVSVGYKTSKKDRKEIVRVMNVKDLESLKAEVKEVLIGNIGKKKKMEVIAKAKEKGIKILNPLKEIKKETEEEGK